MKTVSVRTTAKILRAILDAYLDDIKRDGLYGEDDMGQLTMTADDLELAAIRIRRYVAGINYAKPAARPLVGQGRLAATEP